MVDKGTSDPQQAVAKERSKGPTYYEAAMMDATDLFCT